MDIFEHCDQNTPRQQTQLFFPENILRTIMHQSHKMSNQRSSKPRYFFFKLKILVTTLKNVILSNLVGAASNGFLARKMVGNQHIFAKQKKARIAFLHVLQQQLCVTFTDNQSLFRLFTQIRNIANSWGPWRVL